MMGNVGLLPTIVVLVATLIAGIIDTWRYKVYDVLTWPLFFSAIAYHGFVAGLDGLWFSLAGAAVGYLPLLPWYILGGMGRGDLKLAAGMGAWLGAATMGGVLLASCLAAGVYAVVLLVWSGAPRDVWSKFKTLAIRLCTGNFSSDEQVRNTLSRTDRRRRAIPFAAMLAVGLIAQLAGLDRLIHF